MNKIILSFAFLVFFHCSFSQAVGIGTTNPAPSSILELHSSNKGFLPPRMTSTERNAIVAPANGLLIWNTEDSALNVYRAGNGWAVLVDTSFYTVKFAQKLNSTDTLYLYNAMKGKMDTSSGRLSGSLLVGSALADTNQICLFFGNSVTYRKLFSTAVAKSLNSIEVNKGIEGTAMTNFSSRYNEIPIITAANSNAYKYLFFDYGINDCRLGYSYAVFSNALRAAIDTAIGRGWVRNKIVVISPNYCSKYGDKLQPYADSAISVAKLKGVQYTMTYYYMKNNGGDALLSDGSHPSIAGGLIMAKSILSNLDGGAEFSGSVNILKSLDVAHNLTVKDSLIYGGSIYSAGVTKPNGAEVGDVIVRQKAGFKALNLDVNAGLRGEFIPLTTGFKTEINNSIGTTGGIDFNVSNGTNDTRRKALSILSGGVATFYYPFVTTGLTSSANIAINPKFSLMSTDAGVSNELMLNDNGKTTLWNRFGTGAIAIKPSAGANGTSDSGMTFMPNSLVYGTTPNQFLQLSESSGATLGFGTRDKMSLSNGATSITAGGMGIGKFSAIGLYLGGNLNATARLSIGSATTTIPSLQIAPSPYFPALSGAIHYNGTNLLYTDSTLITQTIINSSGQQQLSNKTFDHLLVSSSADIATIGTSTLIGGTITVNTKAVTAASKIFTTVTKPGGAQGFLSVPTISSGEFFIINSTSATETSTVNWWIIN